MLDSSTEGRPWRRSAWVLLLVWAVPVAGWSQEERGAKPPSPGTGGVVARLHVLVVAATDDPRIGTSVSRDIEHIDFVFRHQTPADLLKLTVVKGRQVSPDGIVNAVRALSVRAGQDTVVVYYCGHGAFDAAAQDHILQTGRGDLSHARLKQALADKQPRLTVLISDACSTFKPIQGLAAAPWPLETLTPLFHSLFFAPEGVIVACAARPGETAVGTTNGGVFTIRLTETLMENEQERLSWPEVLERVNSRSGDDPLLAGVQTRQQAYLQGDKPAAAPRVRLGIVAERTDRSAVYDGVEVRTVFAGSPATRVVGPDGRTYSLVAGRDVITHVDGVPVRTNEEVVNRVLGSANQQITLRIVDLQTKATADYVADIGLPSAAE